MVYHFELTKHANTRYRESLVRLGHFELALLLNAISVSVPIRAETLGGADFLTFECSPLSDDDLSFLTRHSTLCFFAGEKSECLCPLTVQTACYLPEELPEVLKYKGKTSASFTRLMLNAALSLSAFHHDPGPITVLDPLCGKGTTLFSAAQLGMNAIGLDSDVKAVREAGDYFSRFLKLHGLKHTLRQKSETIGSQALPLRQFQYADTKEHYTAGDTRELILASGNTTLAPGLTRRRPAHLLIADLPYGIQHGPQDAGRYAGFDAFLKKALPCWKNAVLPGGVLALSFNTLTLKTERVMAALRAAGLTPFDDDRFTDLAHEVEQAVVRNVVFALRKKEDGFQ